MFGGFLTEVIYGPRGDVLGDGVLVCLNVLRDSVEAGFIQGLEQGWVEPVSVD